MTSCARRASLVTAVVAVLAAGGLSAVSSASVSSMQARAAAPAVYWGAYMDGSDTYRYLYGGKRGNAPWDASTWSMFESNAGKHVSIVHWGLGTPWWHDFNHWRSTFELVRARGDLSLVDMTTGSVPLRAIANGARDPQILTWMRQAAAYGHPFFLDLDVEMNGNWEPYSPGVHGNTASDFVKMWRHVHDLATQAGASNITWVWAPNVDPRSMFTPYWKLYPGTRYVDWTGLDGFNLDGRSSFQWLFGSSYRRLLRLAPAKPIIVTQTASLGDGSRKAQWIADALSNQLPRHFPQIRALAWFNWRIRQAGRWMPFEIESSSASRRAFANTIASPYYAPGGEYGDLPLLTKISPP